MKKRIVLLLAVLSLGVFGVQLQAAPAAGKTAQKSAGVKVDQSSRKAVTRTFVLAILKQDSAALEKIFSPGLKAALMEQVKRQGRQVDDFQALLKKMLPMIRQGLMRQYKITDAEAAARDENLINKMIAEAEKQQGDMVREINGKWYMTMGAKEKSAPAATGKGYASKRAAAEALIKAVAESDAKAYWELLSPEAQKAIDQMSQNNPKMPKRAVFLAMLLQGMRKELQKEFKLNSIDDVKNDPAIREKIIKDMFSKPDVPFKEINGRWFMHFAM